MGFPVGAAVKTRRVVVESDAVLVKADHDFSRFSLIPSVNLKVDIPATAEESFYQGDTMVTIKCAITQQSSAARHVAEAAFAIPNPSALSHSLPVNSAIAFAADLPCDILATQSPSA